MPNLLRRIGPGRLVAMYPAHDHHRRAGLVGFDFIVGSLPDGSDRNRPRRTLQFTFRTIRGDGFYAAIDPTDPTVVYSEAHYGRLIRFDTQTGEQHLIQPQPPEGESYRWNWSAPLLISHFDHKTVYFAAKYLICAKGLICAKDLICGK